MSSHPPKDAALRAKLVLISCAIVFTITDESKAIRALNTPQLGVSRRYGELSQVLHSCQ